MFETEAACFCDIGNIRSQNQDNFYFNRQFLPQGNQGLSDILLAKASTEQPVCFGVFDGISGAPNGQYAAYLAARAFAARCQSISDAANLPDFWNQLVGEMNVAVAANALRENEGMGTTAVMMGFHHDRVSMCSVGDSRAYRLRDAHLVQLSDDHTDRALLEMLGITGRKPRLQQYIGIRPGELCVEPCYKQLSLQAEDVCLICSDGITDMLTDTEILSLMLHASSAGQCAKELRRAALEHGGKDNLTAIIIKVIKAGDEQ